MLIRIPISNSNIVLEGNLSLPANSSKLVIFVHGSGSNKTSIRNQYVSQSFNESNIGTLLFDLLTHDEQESDTKTERMLEVVPGLILNKFNIKLLANRLIEVTNFIFKNIYTKDCKLAYFGTSVGAAAAFMAYTKLKDRKIKTIISRGGRPDLVPKIEFNNINIPILFIIGEKDKSLLYSTKKIIRDLKNKNSKIEVIRNASHLFQEPNTLEVATKKSKEWLDNYL